MAWFDAITNQLPGLRERRHIIALRDSFAMLGLLGGDEDGRPWEQLRPD